MPIHGTIEEAGLPDVLQLLALGRKTGRLGVVDGEAHGEIYLDVGRISFASVANRDRLGEMLVRSGRITREQLNDAMTAQARTSGRQLGRILLDSGHVERMEVERCVRAQVEEAVYSLFTWKRGTFSFESDRRPSRGALLVSLDAESLLLEGARRVDEWSLIERKIPSFDLIYQRSRTRTSTGASDELTEDQKHILPLLDGTHDLHHVVDATGLNEFDVGKAVYGLLVAGFIQMVERRTEVRHLDYRELLAYVVREAEYADPQRRKAAARHIVDCPSCTERLRTVHVRRTEGRQVIDDETTREPTVEVPAARPAPAAVQTAPVPRISPSVAAAAASPAPAPAVRPAPAPAPSARPAPAPAPAAASAPTAPVPTARERRHHERRGGQDRRLFDRRAGLDRRQRVIADWAQQYEERRVALRRAGDGPGLSPQDRRKGAERRDPAHDRRRAGGRSASATRSAAAPATPAPSRRPTTARKIPTPPRETAAPAAPPAATKAPAPRVSPPPATKAPAPTTAAPATPKALPAAAPEARPAPKAMPAAAQAAPPAPAAPPVPAAAVAPAPTPAATEPSSAPTAATSSTAAAPTSPASPPRERPAAPEGEFVWLMSPDESMELIRQSRTQLRPPAAPVAPPTPPEGSEAAEGESAAASGTANKARAARRSGAAAARTRPPGVGAVPTGAAASGATAPVLRLEPATPEGIPAPALPAPTRTAKVTASAKALMDPEAAVVIRVRHLVAAAALIVVGVAGYLLGSRTAGGPSGQVVAVPPATETAAAEPVPATTRSPARTTPPVSEPAARGTLPADTRAAARTTPPPRQAATAPPTTPAIRQAANPPTGAAGQPVQAAPTPTQQVAAAPPPQPQPAAAEPAPAAAAPAPSAARAVVPTGPAPATSQPDADLATGGWSAVGREEAAQLLGGAIGVIPGLHIESITRSVTGSRARVRIVQITSAGERIALTETRAGAAVRGAGPMAVTALRVMPASEAYPFSTGTVSFGNLLITVKTTVPVDALQPLLQRIAEY